MIIRLYDQVELSIYYTRALPVVHKFFVAEKYLVQMSMYFLIFFIKSPPLRPLTYFYSYTLIINYYMYNLLAKTF